MVGSWRTLWVFPDDALVVLAGQSVGHRTDQLLPGGLGLGSELLGEVAGQDDDQDVTQELGGEEQKTQLSNCRVAGSRHPALRSALARATSSC